MIIKRITLQFDKPSQFWNAYNRTDHPFDNVASIEVRGRNRVVTAIYENVKDIDGLLRQFEEVKE